MNVRNFYPLLIFLSIIALFAAYFVEYILHLAVCPLCVYQRFPYLLYIFTALAAIAGGKYKIYNNFLIFIAIAAILLSGYHAGIERGVFGSSSLCTSLISVTNDISVNDFKKLLYNSGIGMCNRPALIIWGFSMAEWNLILNIIILMIISIIVFSSKNKY